VSTPRVVVPQVLMLGADEEVPNNPYLPVLHYHGVLDAGAGDLAASFEALFDAHRWPAAWRNGIFGHHHFHSTAHEALGIYAGTVTVRLGGAGGRDVVLRPGDVVVLPAGTAHRRIACRGRLGVVGAYPAGQRPDQCVPDAARLAQRTRAVGAVALPAEDPVYGPRGPLVERWRAGSGRPHG
jgi:uncharacterized protein YjlB